MAVTSVNEMWSNHSFEVRSKGGFNKTARIRQGWQVVVDPGTTELEISDSNLLPATNTIFSNDLDHMWLRERVFTQTSPVLWIAVMTYEGEVGIQGAPWQNPPEISWTDATTSEPIDRDWNNNPIVTANDEPIDGVTVDIADLVLNVNRNYQSFNPAATFAYRHSTNSDTFQGFAPGTGRLVGFNAKQKFSSQFGGYWNVDARIQFRYPFTTTFARAWWARVRHEGYNEKRGGIVGRATDDYGDPTVTPVLLKSDGTRETNINNAHYLEFQLYDSLPYNALGLL